MLELSVIKENIERVQTHITAAANRAGRDPDAVKLVVVTKAHSLSALRSVVEAGARCLGESYVEEALPKISAMDQVSLEWHMIGHVQSRKARAVANHFDYVHSVDRMKLARRLDTFAGEYGKQLQIFLECNISHEASKFGWPAWDEDRWPEFADQIAPLFDFVNLDICGLMCMPPYNPDPEVSRPYFQKLTRLREFLCRSIPQVHLAELSMGMSGDYEVAVEEGATMVRVGTAIVGPRTQ